MPSPTYTAIATTTVGSGGTSSIDFTSIPSTYADLLIVVSARAASGGNASDNLGMTFNSSATGYTDRLLSGNGSTASSSTGTRTEALAGDISGSTGTANTFSNINIYIPNYGGSKNKSYSVDSIQENNTTAANARLIAGLWSNTSAITSISLRYFGGGVNLAQYTSATLYGIKNS